MPAQPRVRFIPRREHRDPDTHAGSPNARTRRFDMKKATHLTDTSVALDRRRFSLGLPLWVAGAAIPLEVVAAKAPPSDEAPIVTYDRTKTIDGIKIFYREA